MSFRRGVISIFFFLGLSLFSAPLAFAQFSPELLHELHSLAADIRAHYPPDRYYYVGLGRSPAGVMRMFEETGTPGKTLPLSKMGHIRGFDRAKLRNFLFDYFARELPSEQELGGRKILFVDWANKGGTLVNTKEFLEEFAKASGNKKAAEAEYLGLHHQGKTVSFINYAQDKVEQAPLSEQLQKAGIHSLPIEPNSALGRAFGGGTEFDAVAEFGSYDVELASRRFAEGGAEPMPSRRSQYDTFGDEIKVFLEGRAAPAKRAGILESTENCSKNFELFRSAASQRRSYSP